MAVSKRKGDRTCPWVFDAYQEMPDGKKRRHTEFFRTKTEAEAAEAQWLKRKPLGRPSVDPMIAGFGDREHADRLIVDT